MTIELYTTLLTPFDKADNIDLGALKTLINHCIKTKSTGVIIASDIGEGLSLSQLEKQILIEQTLEYVNNRIKVIVAITANNIDVIQREVKVWQKYDIDGYFIDILYYKSTPEQCIVSFFQKIADSSVKPIIINLNDHNLKLETLILLSEIKNIKGLYLPNQESSLEILRTKNVNLFINETLLDKGIDLEIPFCISSSSHIYGDTIHTILQLIKTSQKEDALALFQLYRDKFKALANGSQPIVLKSVLNKLGFNIGKVRFPLTDLDYDRLSKLSKTIGI